MLPKYGYYLMNIRLIICLLMLPNLAFAYIDPGTGAYFVQIIIAFGGAVVFYFTHPIQLIKLLLAKLRGGKQPDG